METSTDTPDLAAAAELFDLLAEIGRNARTAATFARLQLSPEALKIHKAKQDGSGVALKLDLRLEPVMDPKGFVRKVEGGLFLELVPQSGTNDAGDATFGWTDARVVKAKLGLPDISSLLTAVNCRYARMVLPPNLQAKKAKVPEATVGMFHVFEGGPEGTRSTTAMEYALAPEGAYLKASKSAEQRQQIMLNLAEEQQLRTYLQHALTMFLIVGKK